MKDQEIIKKSDERKMKRFRQAATGNKLTTVADQEDGNRCINTTVSAAYISVVLSRPLKSTYLYVHCGFPSSPEVSRRKEDVGFSSD